MWKRIRYALCFVVRLQACARAQRLALQLVELEELGTAHDGCAAQLCCTMLVLLFVVRLRCRLRYTRYQMQLLHEAGTACSPLKRGRELAAELLEQRVASSSDEDDESVSSVALVPYGPPPPAPLAGKRRSRWVPSLLQ